MPIYINKNSIKNLVKLNFTKYFIFYYLNILKIRVNFYII